MPSTSSRRSRRSRSRRSMATPWAEDASSRSSGTRSARSSEPPTSVRAWRRSWRSVAPDSERHDEGRTRSEAMKVRRATLEDVPTLVHLFQELDRMQRDWRVFTPRPGFYDEVGLKYRKAMGTDQAVVLVAEH